MRLTVSWDNPTPTPMGTSKVSGSSPSLFPMLTPNAHPAPEAPVVAATPCPGHVAVVGCRVLESEIAALTRDATHIVRRELFEMGLHDQPSALRLRLADAIARAEDDPAVEAIVLVYGLCGLALVDLAARRCPLVVDRAHDCLTLFLGCKGRYADAMRNEPGIFWYAPGWNRDKRVPGHDRTAKLRADYREKFDPDQVEALLDMERETFALHSCAAYTDLRLPGDDDHRQYARQCAQELGWRFEYHPGDGRLLRDLLHGPWDPERFLVVQPGQRIAHVADASIIKAVP